MSFILDALKKSETERQQQSGAEFSNVPSGSDEPQSLKWLWILGALLVINLAVLMGILLRPDASPPPAMQTPPQVESAPATAMAAAADEPSFEEQLAEARERQADRELAAASAQQEIEPAPAVAAPAPSTPAARTSSRRLSTIDELRLNGDLQLPDLHLDIHVYSDVAEERFVFINMVKHRERSRLDEGPVVNEITPEGVVLDYQGRTFLLPRE